MNKTSYLGVSLVGAIPGGFLCYMLVKTFLDYADKMGTMFLAVSGIALAGAAVVTVIPIMVLIFGSTPKSEKPPKPTATKPAKGKKGKKAAAAGAAVAAGDEDFAAGGFGDGDSEFVDGDFGGDSEFVDADMGDDDDNFEDFVDLDDFE